MDIIFNKLYRIDAHTSQLEELPNTGAHSDLSGYITQLIEDISEDGDNKEFSFPSETTEVRNLINTAIATTEYDNTSLNIAKRLLDKEIAAQAHLDSHRLNIEIPKGMLVIAMIQYTAEIKKYIISKAEYSEFIDDITFLKRQGPPIKKKIYKAFSLDITNDLDVQKVAIYDTSTTLAKYWWREFLELAEKRNDNDNTKDAFAAIDLKILTPIKANYKRDYIALRNCMVHYFRSNEEFRLNHFIDTAIGDYEPFDSALNIDVIKNKIREAPTKYKFDNRFEIIKKLIKAKFIKDIALTDQIELRLKEDIPELENVIYRKVINNRKYVLIRSDAGYEYFPDFVEQDNGANIN